MLDSLSPEGLPSWMLNVLPLKCAQCNVAADHILFTLMSMNHMYVHIVPQLVVKLIYIYKYAYDTIVVRTCLSASSRIGTICWTVHPHSSFVIPCMHAHGSYDPQKHSKT